jgi:16S rRNA processing protein RimM
MAAAPLVAVGQVLRPVGLGGEVRVRPLTDRPRERFGALTACWLWDPGTDARRRERVLGCRFEGDQVVLGLESADSPEAARRLTGQLLAVEREQALPAPPGHFYPWELEGAAVETADGRPLGRFLRVEEAPAAPLWVIGDGEREWLLPAVPEMVLEVSVARRRIVVDPPEGLVEISR